MKTQTQRQYRYGPEGWGLAMNHSQARGRSVWINHSRAVGRALTSNHSRAVATADHG